MTGPCRRLKVNLVFKNHNALQLITVDITRRASWSNLATTKRDALLDGEDPSTGPGIPHIQPQAFI